MDDKFNTIAGWVLGAGIVMLGLNTISSHIFEANKNHRPEKMGFAIAGVEEEGAAGAPAVPLPVLLAKADPAKGEMVFKKCAACHTDTQGGANSIGPNLWGVVGDHIAEGRGGFAFSDALKKHGGNWSFDSLNEWLTNPRKFADGTKMTFAGLDSAEDRANVIVFLNTHGSNLPLPAPPAADAKTADAKAGGEAPKEEPKKAS